MRPFPYQRTVGDGPCGGHQAHLVLRVRKLYCRNPDRPRKVFTERVRRCALNLLVGGVQHH